MISSHHVKIIAAIYLYFQILFKLRGTIDCFIFHELKLYFSQENDKKIF